MSTKIYSGFKFETSNMFEIIEILESHQAEVKAGVEKKVINFIVSSAIEKFDSEIIKGKKTCDNYVYAAIKDMRDREREVQKTKQRDPAIDFEVELVLLPFEGSFYGIYYSEHSEFRKSLLKHSKVSDFSYWNNTDKPSKITVKQWEERGRIWNEIFAKNFITKEVGFTRTLNQGLPQLTYDVIAQHWNKHIPKFEKRLTYWTNETYCSQELDKKYQTAPVDKDGQTDVSQIMSDYFDVRSDTSATAQEKRNNIRKLLEEKLVKEVTMQLLGVEIQSKKKVKMN